jgi:hypothetical protein
MSLGGPAAEAPCHRVLVLRLANVLPCCPVSSSVRNAAGKSSQCCRQNRIPRGDTRVAKAESSDFSIGAITTPHGQIGADTDPTLHRVAATTITDDTIGGTRPRNSAGSAGSAGDSHKDQLGDARRWALAVRVLARGATLRV